MERNIKNLELNLEGKKSEIEESHFAYLCDIIEEISLTDKRAGRLLYSLLTQLGLRALDDKRLEKFIDTHMPGKANYKLLTDWITEIQRNNSNETNKEIIIKYDDIESLANLAKIIKGNLDKTEGGQNIFISMHLEVHKFSQAKSIKSFDIFGMQIVMNGNIVIIKDDHNKYRMESSTFYRVMSIITKIYNCERENIDIDTIPIISIMI